MALGPIEVLVIGFDGNRFNGRIISEIETLIDQGTISVVDGLLITKDAASEVHFVEFEQNGVDERVAAFRSLLADTVEDLISAEDVEAFAEGLEPDTSAAVLVFEHTWAKPFRDSIVEAGGFLVSDFRVPGPAIEEMLGAVSTS